MKSSGLIGIYNEELESIRFIHVVSGMYWENVGTLLRHQYTTKEKIHKLLNLGDLIYVGETPEAYRPYEDPEMLTAYHPFHSKCVLDLKGKRDARKVDVDPMSGMTWAMCKGTEIDDSFVFVFVNGKWRGAKV